MAIAAQDFITLLTYQHNPQNAAVLAAHNRQVQQSVTKTAAVVGAVTGLIGGLVAGALTSLASGVRDATLGVIRANDNLTMSYARINDSIGDMEQAKVMYEGLYGLAMETGIAVNESARAFSRFRNSTKEIGATNEQVLTLVETLQKAAILNGSTAAEVNSVTIQLSQAFGNPTLMAQELNSLLDAAPDLVRAIAKEFGIAYGEIKKFTEEGKITIPRVFKAILDYSGQVEKRFAALPMTVGRAWDILGVAVERFVAEANEAFGINKALSATLQYLAYLTDRMRTRVIPAVKSFVDAVGGLGNIAKLAGYALLAMVGPAVLSAIGSAITAIRTLNMAILTTYARMLLIPGAILAAILLLEDLYYWMTGGDSSIGARLGPFDQFVAGIREAMGEWGFLLDVFKNGLNFISEMDKGLLALMGTLILLVGPIRTLSVALQFAIGLWQGFWRAIALGRGVAVPRPQVPIPPSRWPTGPSSPIPKTGPAAAAGVFGGLAGVILPFVAEGASRLGDNYDGSPEAQGERRRRFNARGNLEGFYGPNDGEKPSQDAEIYNQETRKFFGGFFSNLAKKWNGEAFTTPLNKNFPAPSTNNNVNITVNQNNTVNATGVNPSEISAATNRAVPTGDDIGRALSERLSRSLMQANPRSESAAQ